MIKIGGYTFKSNLIERALTHSSFSSQNYERLEFLGDSILDFLVADILFKNQGFDESKLTRARANIVSEENLAKIFDKLNLTPLVKVGKSCKIITKAIKGDIIESIIATIYVESGVECCLNFINENFDITVDETKDYKSLFQEKAQSLKYVFEYKLDKAEGPAHNLTFYMSLYVNNQLISSASGRSKAEAEKECAKIALNLLESKG